MRPVVADHADELPIGRLDDVGLVEAIVAHALGDGDMADRRPGDAVVARLAGEDALLRQLASQRGIGAACTVAIVGPEVKQAAVGELDAAVGGGDNGVDGLAPGLAAVGGAQTPVAVPALAVLVSDLRDEGLPRPLALLLAPGELLEGERGEPGDDNRALAGHTGAGVAVVDGAVVDRLGLRPRLAVGAAPHDLGLAEGAYVGLAVTREGDDEPPVGRPRDRRPADIPPGLLADDK